MFFGTAVSADIQFKLNTDTENTENTNSDSTVGIKLSDGFSFEVIDAKNTMYYKIKNNMTDEITEKNPDMLTSYISKFTDFGGDEWFANDVLLPMYFNVLSGYENGTLKPSNPITSAEVAKVISATFEDGLAKGTKNWYDMYYKYCAKAFTYDSYAKMGANYDDYMSNHQMTRAEIAYVIANYVDANSGELQSYIANAKQGNVGSLSRFSDCGNIALDDDGTLNEDLRIMGAGWIPSRYAGALSFLVDKGVFQGNPDGTMSPISPVSRAEVFALLNRVCKATPSYTSGQFKGDSTSINNADVPDKPSTGNTGKAPTPWSGGQTTDYNAWQSRPGMTINLTDGTRGRAKVGDTVVTADGTSYYLDHTGIFVGDTEVAGVGLPVATDLGRLNYNSVPLTSGERASTHEFGWISSDVSTGGQTYKVFAKTGEGHWDVEWMAIQKATKPTEDGTEGQISPDGYWKYGADTGWRWLVG
jgi:hypothetical protein